MYPTNTPFPVYHQANGIATSGIPMNMDKNMIFLDHFLNNYMNYKTKFLAWLSVHQGNSSESWNIRQST